MAKVYLRTDNKETHPFPFSLFGENVDGLLEFYNSEKDKICFIEGAQGSFKTDTFNYTLKYLSNDVLVFRFNCFEGSTLDDIFLAFFEDMKKYSQQRKISFTKLDTNSLSQRINTYLNHISLPCVIVFDSFENILSKSNPVEKEEIIAYIKHLNSSSKYKIVILTNKFDKAFYDLFDDKFLLRFNNLSKSAFDEYFRNQNIVLDLPLLDRFYSIALGNVFYLLLTINIVNTLKISLVTLLDEFASRKMSYEDFLLQKLLTFIPESCKKSLYKLSFFNIGLSSKYLIENNLFTQEQINYLLQKYLIKEENGCIFIKPYCKKFLLKNLYFDKQDVHSYWSDFYNTQLPLTPNNRAVLISRNTMRSQIDYHSSYLAQNNRKEKLQADMSLMSYLNSNLTDWNHKNAKKKLKSASNDEPVTQNSPLQKYELTKNELSLLSLPVDLKKQQEVQKKEELYCSIEKSEENLLKNKNKSLLDVFDDAKIAEAKHDFELAYTIYCSMLSMKNDVNFYEYEPLILDSLALCAKKQNKTIDAIDFYNKLTELYLIRKDIENHNETRLKIASIYKEMYKINHARVIWENFVNKKSKASDKIIVKSYLELADIEESLSNTDKSVEFYKKAFALVDGCEALDKNYIAQAYYKYALILDDYNQMQAAMAFYQKCIKTAENDETFVAGAYVNLAQIFLESGNIVKTTECYQKALFIDEKLKNYDGVYYVSYKMSQIAEMSAPELVKDFLLKSLAAAKKTNEYICVTNAYIELGDYYLKTNNNHEALKYYLLAQKSLVKDDFYDENIRPIMMRVNDLKSKVPQSVYNEVINNLEKNNYD